MRIFKPAFWLMAMLVGTSFAADGVVASRVVPNNLATGRDSVADENVARTTTSRTTANRTTVSRATPSNAAGNRSDGRGNVASRTNANRSVASRGSDSTTSRTNTNRSTVSRATTTNASRGTASRATTTQSRAATVTQPRSTNVTRASVAGNNTSSSTRRAATTTRGGTSTNTGRATITTRGSSAVLGTGAIRMSTATVGTQDSITETRENLERSSDLHKTCQVQYNECMDQFCAVLDENQKRCSCSSNLSRYSKTEKAVTEATEQLNEVAQSIRYVGLSADEIRAILTETEAEEAMRDTKDNSVTRNMLQQIEEMIKDPTSHTNTYVSEMEFGLDLDLSFSSEALDILNLDFLHLGTNSSSISNTRGAELYKTAKKRCATILDQCKEAGAVQDQIVGDYDMAIDRDCVAYEADLKQRNETLLSNVRSANLILQKARLAVLQNKNQYDALGCVAALENCMKDDMVCGEEYMQCIDPTKTYVDGDGSVIMGQDITVIQSFMSEYNNAVLDKTFLQEAYNTKIGPKTCAGDGKCVVGYLLHKIGTQQKTTDEGLCRAVLDKCQNYTYDSNRKYKPYNDIVINYLQRAMTSIKAAQQRIISDYASNCITDVSACYSQQVSQIGSLTTNKYRDDVYSIMRGACRSVALTCGLAIFTGKPEIEVNQDLVVDGETYNVSDCKYITDGVEYGKPAYNNAIINCISDMFYDSLLDNLDSESDSGDYIDPDDNDGCAVGYAMTDNGCAVVTYSITYELNGGDFGVSHPDSATYNREFEVSPPTKNGYVFAGWNISGMDETRHKIGAAESYNRAVTSTTAKKFMNLISTSGTVSFAATWRDITELGAFVPDSQCEGLMPEVDGGCVAPGYRCPSGYRTKLSGVCEYIVIPTNNSGNGGSGSNSDQGGTGDDDQGGIGDGSETPSDTPTTTEYTIHYNCAGGSGSINDQSCVSGKLVTLADVGGCGTQTGKTLVGWDSGATTYQCNGNATFTAQWSDAGGSGEEPVSCDVYTQEYDINCVGLNNPAGCVKAKCKCKSGFNLSDGQCVSSTPYTVKYACGTGSTGNPSKQSERVSYAQNWSLPENPGCTPSKSSNTFDGWHCKLDNSNAQGDFWLDPDVHMFYGANCRSGGCPQGDGGYVTRYLWNDDVTCSAEFYEGGLISCSDFSGYESATLEQCPTHTTDTSGRLGGCLKGGCKCPDDKYYNNRSKCISPSCGTGSAVSNTCFGSSDESCLDQHCKCNDGLVPNSEHSACVSTYTVTYSCGDGVDGTVPQETVKFSDVWNPKLPSECTTPSEKYFGGWRCMGGERLLDSLVLDGDTNEFFYNTELSGHYNEKVTSYVWNMDTICIAQWDDAPLVCDTDKGMRADVAECDQYIYDPTATGVGGCVKKGCACNEDTIYDVETHGCVAPCAGIEKSEFSDECADGTEDGCVAKYCKCETDYSLVDGACVSNTNPDPEQGGDPENPDTPDDPGTGGTDNPGTGGSGDSGGTGGNEAGGNDVGEPGENGGGGGSASDPENPIVYEEDAPGN